MFVSLTDAHAARLYMQADPGMCLRTATSTTFLMSLGRDNMPVEPGAQRYRQHLFGQSAPLGTLQAPSLSADQIRRSTPMQPFSSFWKTTHLPVLQLSIC